jgi:hypothetical protein
MAEVRIILSGLWVAVMLTYLLGDVLRVFAGHMTPGEIGGRKLGQGAWLGIAVIMLIPIVMVVLSLTLPYPAIGRRRLQPRRPAVRGHVRQLPDPRERGLQRIDRLVRMDVGFHGRLASSLEGPEPRRPGSQGRPWGRDL